MALSTTCGRAELPTHHSLPLHPRHPTFPIPFPKCLSPPSTYLLLQHNHMQNSAKKKANWYAVASQRGGVENGREGAAADSWWRCQVGEKPLIAVRPWTPPFTGSGNSHPWFSMRWVLLTRSTIAGRCTHAALSLSLSFCWCVALLFARKLSGAFEWVWWATMLVIHNSNLQLATCNKQLHATSNMQRRRQPWKLTDTSMAGL